jgi:hypothetical protein
MEHGMDKQLVRLVLLVCLVAFACATRAMTLEQMRALPAARLLNLRMDEVFARCGLPTAIADLAGAKQKKRDLRWKGTVLSLSTGEWDVFYARQPEPAPRNAWLNPNEAGRACLVDAARLVLHGREVGTIIRTKKTQGYGYITRYQTSPDTLEAHRVLATATTWSAPVSETALKKKYGQPDEIAAGRAGEKLLRYWVVTYNKQSMPENLYAVDFRISTRQRGSPGYAIHTDRIDFVRTHLDKLVRDWERAFVLD